MSKSINLFGFHSIESLLITNPESIIKVSIQSNRKDKRALELINTLTRQKIPFFSSNGFFIYFDIKSKKLRI